MYQPKQINVSLLNSYNEYCQEIGRLDAKENSLANFRTRVLYSDMVIQSDKDSYRFYRLTWASHYKEQLVSVISRLPNGKHDLNDIVQQNAQLFEEMNIVTGLELAEICIKLHIKRYINSELTFSLTSSPTLIKYNPKYPLSGDSPRVPIKKDNILADHHIEIDYGDRPIDASAATKITESADSTQHHIPQQGPMLFGSEGNLSEVLNSSDFKRQVENNKIETDYHDNVELIKDYRDQDLTDKEKEDVRDQIWLVNKRLVQKVNVIKLRD